MSKSHPINDRDRRLEQIVAYLDGELSSVEVSLVECQIAEDADFRHELKSIEQAWSALDVLPATKVDDSFSRTTMEVVISEARQELMKKTRALPIQRRKNSLRKVLLVAAAAALGFLIVRLVRENPNRVLLSDLPAIQYIDVYSQVSGVDFIRRLSEQFGDKVWVADLSAEELSDKLDEFQRVSDVSRRRQWIDQLDNLDRTALRARYNRFVSFTPEEQARIRDTHAELYSAVDSQELQQTMLQYQIWFNSLQASQQFELRNMPVIDRVNEVTAYQRREANNPWIELSPSELRSLDRALIPIREQLFRERSVRQGGEVRGRNMAFRPDLRRQLAEHREEWFPQILDALSAETREKFESLPYMQQHRQVGRWIMGLLNWEDGPGRGPQRFGEVSQQELERFFVEETGAKKKEELLAKPRDILVYELERMYFRDELGQGEFPPESRPFGPPRGDGRGPRRDFDRPPGRQFEGPPFDRPGIPPPPPEQAF